MRVDSALRLIDSFSGGRDVSQQNEARSGMSVQDAKRNAERANETWKVNHALWIESQRQANEQIRRANALLKA